MAKFSAPIQLFPFPGHCSQKLFFLFPIPTSLFFIKLIFFTVELVLVPIMHEILATERYIKQTTINKSIRSAHPVGIK